MASLTSNSLSLKVALISTGIISVAVVIKTSVPALTDLVPVMYRCVVAWLRPPYLYLVMNAIIISIVASSKLHVQKDDKAFKPPLEMNPAAADKIIDGGSVFQHLNAEPESKFSQGDEGEILVRRGSIQEEQELFEKVEKEQPLHSKRFANKKSVKANPQGGKATTLGVSKSKRHDTLENTWKMITDGRAMPLTRHLKKSDTWDTNPVPRPEKIMKKSETFNEKKPPSRQGSGKVLRREPSLSQDELNKRVEAFINKFNEEMRLQRQESLNQYKEMVARGAY
ncbi:hypothetical protein M5689_013559 [Euphorbia peplus]|nr:hypothetical protein M5689_013559 [Euphorbia peplus]